MPDTTQPQPSPPAEPTPPAEATEATEFGAQPSAAIASRFGTPFDELRDGGLRPTKLATRAARDAVYLGIGFPVGMAICIVICTLATISVATAILIVGLQLALLTLEASRWAAELERGRARIVDDRPITARYRPRPRSANELFAGLGDGRPWRDFAYAMLQAPFTFAAGLIATVGWTLALGLVLAPTYVWAFEGPDLDVFGMQVDGVPEALLSMVIGIVLVPMVFLACRVATWLSVTGTRLVLGDREQAAA